jgi:hypothetical protein
LDHHGEMLNGHLILVPLISKLLLQHRNFVL